MTSFDFGKLQQAAQAEQQAHEKEVYKRTARVTNTFGGRLMLNANDETAELIEVLLGVKPGGMEKVAEMLGAHVGGPKALTDGSDESPAKERPLPVFNPDGTNAGVALREPQAIQAGYGYKYDDQNTHIGWQKPPADNSAPAPNQATTRVPVHNKDNQPIPGRTVSIEEGNNHKGLDPVGDANGKITHFKVRGGFNRFK